ncbi:MAG: DUF4339 domain-containing protein, partial [Rhodospirillales bacterium]
MHEWFFHVDGREIGPFDYHTAVRYAERRPDVLCRRQGFPEWIPASRIGAPVPPAGAGASHRPPPAGAGASH